MCENYTLDCKEETQGCKGCAYCKKSADEMFKELGYEKIEDTYDREIYEKEGLYMDRIIRFELVGKFIVCEYGTGESLDFNIQELRAINKRVEELKWK